MNIIKSKRDNTISIVKAIGIILMVIGHADCPKVLYNFICMFHVPLFFICSGFFYKEIQDRKQLFTFVKKRFKGLYLPFIKWSIVFLLLHNLFFHLDIYSSSFGYNGNVSTLYSVKDIIKRGIYIIFTMSYNEQLLGAFWFLRTLLLSSISVAIVDFALKERFKNKYIWLLLFFVVTSIISRKYAISPPYIYDLSRIALGSAFFISGILFRQYKHILSTYQVILVLVSVLVVSRFLPYSMLSVPAEYLLIYFICAVACFIAIYSITSKIKGEAHTYTILYIGEHTMIILALHFLCFKLVSLIKIYIYGLPIEYLSKFPVIEEYNSYMWILYSIIGIAIPLLVEHTYIKIKQKTNECFNYRS